ncbi:MAG: hydroxymethylglutaryl-CoA reductase, degradative [Deltaproteobacteria bacterium]|nr:hydroxymethylglutaryl-CoA reductase, degradative [Deltaproteobacteria bacterium]
MTRSSRIAGFYTRPLAERRRALAEVASLSDAARAWLDGGGGLDLAVADRMSENVVATIGLPLGVALNLRVNGKDHVVPMAVEEPSVIAAASNAARMVRLGGGFTADADAPIMTAQIWLDEVGDADRACVRIADEAAALRALGDAAIPRMVARGGGCRDVTARIVGDGIVVVEVDLDVGDAMGANLVDTVAEAVAPAVARLTGGRVGMRILTNLPRGRRVRASCVVPAEAVGGDGVVAAIARASHFAELDAARAATHNKGIMNGIDAAAVALGQDWRAIEAGAHAFAARSGRYAPLATWQRTERGLAGSIELPMAVGIVGGGTHTAAVKAALEVVDVASARELACVIAAIGLASNLAALRALAGEGIQRGHMRLHQRRHDEAAASPSTRTGEP